MTALGAIRVRRSHGCCRHCGQPEFAADRLLGLDGWLTARAERMACLAGIHDPFRKAEQLLSELAGWSVDAETVRRRCHAAASRARQGRAGRDGVPASFAQAPGDRELHIDAGKVNTPDGWRDVKVAVFACRQRGQPATAADYEQRDLPTPAARSVVAEVEAAEAFGPRCQAEAQRLGVSAAELSVLGDGAEWIWNLGGREFPGAGEVLDLYHGAEHIAAAAREVFGEEAAEARAQAERGRDRLLADGYRGVVEWVGELTGVIPAGGDGAALGEMLNYFCGHQGRLSYALRLRRGQVIGSGLVEGTIKQRVNVRMKRSGARWQPDQVGPFVELMALADSPEWGEYWAGTPQG
jgi:hypothetical protein